MFQGNNQPGVMLAGAVRSYLGRYGVRAGTRAVVVTTTDGAYRAALELAKGGIEIAAIADLRAKSPTARRKLRAMRVSRSSPARTCAGRGAACAYPASTSTGATWPATSCSCRAECFAPAVHLFSQSRGRLTWSDATRAFVPSVSAERAHPAGAGRGIFGLSAALADGAAAGLAAARAQADTRHPRCGSR